MKGDPQGLETGVTAISGEERGFSLMEVIVATVIATVAVLGLAHSFGTGRALIDRYERARVATALVQGRLESLASLATRNPSDPALSVGTHGPALVSVGADGVGLESWSVVWVDDPLDGLGGADDYERVTVSITWNWGTVADTVQLTRILRTP
jgi:prepilin-type N-terminal cleavage/methylation domain-containing protein